MGPHRAGEPGKSPRVGPPGSRRPGDYLPFVRIASTTVRVRWVCQPAHLLIVDGDCDPPHADTAPCRPGAHDARPARAGPGGDPGDRGGPRTRGARGRGRGPALRVFGALERSVVAGKTLLGRRASEAGTWREAGHRSPASWVAQASGTSLGEAIAVLETGERLGALPDTAAALRRGEVSGPRPRRSPPPPWTRRPSRPCWRWPGSGG
ncbi:MAG TPA: DUF222 domain-containing protein [Acidimicrobiales bacterium]|nr:DUF222 domain-containing protein [Acidimicrobiales bacterium]